MRQFAAALLSVLALGASFAFILHRSNAVTSRGKNPENETHERSGALAALDFWTRSRSYPDADIPASAYYRAFQSAKLAKNNPRGPSAAAVWKPIGPLNLQGRSISVALNP